MERGERREGRGERREERGERGEERGERGEERGEFPPPKTKVCGTGLRRCRHNTPRSAPGARGW